MAILSHNKLFAYSLSGNFNLIGVGLNDWVFHDFNWGSEILRNLTGKMLMNWLTQPQLYTQINKTL